MSVIEWNNLDTDIRSSESIGAFLKNILAFIRQTPNFTSNCHNPKGLKILAPLRPEPLYNDTTILQQNDANSPWAGSSKKWYLAPVGGQNIIKIFSSLTVSIY